MSYFVVDVESDGPLLGTNSMVCFGAVLLNRELETTFYGTTAPVSKLYDPNALAISGFTREEHEKFDDPAETMIRFYEWVHEHSKGRPIFLSDNNGYDFAWINWYFLTYGGKNPFGWSSRRIGDLFCGFFNDPYYKWKKHRKTHHSHNPVDDAVGNAEATLYLIDNGFKMKL